MKGFAGVAGNERFAPEQHNEQTERVVSPRRIVGESVRPLVQQVEFAAGQVQRLADIDFEKALGDR